MIRALAQQINKSSVNVVFAVSMSLPRTASEQTVVNANAIVEAKSLH